MLGIGCLGYLRPYQWPLLDHLKQVDSEYDPLTMCICFGNRVCISFDVCSYHLGYPNVQMLHKQFIVAKTIVFTPTEPIPSSRRSVEMSDCSFFRGFPEA